MHYLNRSQEQNKNEGEIQNPTNRIGGGNGDWWVRDREMPQPPPADTEGGAKEAGLHKAGRGRVTTKTMGSSGEAELHLSRSTLFRGCMYEMTKGKRGGATRVLQVEIRRSTNGPDKRNQTKKTKKHTDLSAQIVRHRKRMKANCFHPHVNYQNRILIDVRDQ